MYCLIASANPVVARSIQSWLKKKGVLSSVVMKGADAARTVLEKKMFDVIFLDISLMDLTGIEVGHLIRSEDCVNQNSKIVLFGAIMDDADKFISDGLECYLQSSLIKSNLETMLTTWTSDPTLPEPSS